jgi:hypothetical protein
VYEGDVRFEHCYRVDEERGVPIQDKLQCWRDWTHRYHYGQSRDRIGYARARERTLAHALAAGQQAAPRGAAGELAPPALPQPTSAFAPPPRTMTAASATDANTASEANRAAREGAGDAGARTEASLASGESIAALTDAPGASCAGACGKTWNSCKQPCKGAPCRTGCDDQYRGCMRSCF